MEFAAQCTNCTSPDTGNMEVLARYGTPEQRERWLVPLLEGKIRSCFAMTEPNVASSDATNIEIQIDKDHERGEFALYALTEPHPHNRPQPRGRPHTYPAHPSLATTAGEYVINGSKWWITGAGSLHCEIIILMGKTDTSAALHRQQSQILVPMSTPGITLLRPMTAFGDDDAPKGHMEIVFDNVRVPFANVLLGEGRGFEISQGRLGPGRIHHCMRMIGQGERSLAAMCARVQEREAFRKILAKNDVILQDIAKCRADIDTCRLLVHRAAELMDERGNADGETRQLLSLVKAHIPVTLQGVVDRCIQVGH